MDENREMESEVFTPSGNGQDPYFQFSDREKSGVFVARYKPSRVMDDKKYSSCALASSLNALNRIYPNAIEVTSPVSQVVRSGELIAGLFTAAFSVFALYFLITVIRDSSSIALMIILFAAFYIFAVASIWIFRAPFIQPTDLPIIFNKKTRQVSFMRMRLPNLLKCWAPLVTEYKTYAWDTVRARTYQVTSRMVGTSAITTSTSGKLCLLWGNDPDEPRQFKDWVAVGFNKEDEHLLQLWEHIRRYMEEGGPAILPGETLHRGVYDSRWKAPKPEFPTDVVADAGGQPLNQEQIAALVR